MTESTGSGISGNELLKKNNKKMLQKVFYGFKTSLQKMKTQ